MKFVYSSLFLFLFACTAGYSQSNLNYYLPDDVTYNPAIPTPAEVIGHEVGQWHVTHDKLVSYMYALAEASDRAVIEEIGRTYEDRPLLHLTITAPGNHASIEEIKANQQLLSDAGQSGNLDIESMPVIINMGFSIHGNEPSGSNASMLTAYYLTAAEGGEIEEILENTVILLDPSFNPDGLNRFATWANIHKSIHAPVTDPDSREFDEVWPGGRTNHYWFDLNRDWMPVQHPESRARVTKFHEWKPNILTDHHEMGSGSTFFFQPGIPSRTHPLTPQINQDLTAAIGEYHAEALDGIKSLYFTKESYDDFYYGKGSTYPDVFGTIGILFEQASSRGHAQETEHGVLEFPFTIRNQFTTSLSTLRAANALRTDLHEYRRQFYSDVAEEAADASVRAIVVGDSKDRGKNYHFADLFSFHDVEFYPLASDLEVDGKEFKKGMAWVIPTEQPQKTFIEAMFEARTEFTDSLFYDISTWTLPFAFNMPYAELSGRNYDSSLLGERVETPEKPEGQVIGGQSSYAYIFEWHDYYAPKALYKLQGLGLRTKVATLPTEIETAEGVREFGYGSILISLGIQEMDEDEVYGHLQEIAAENGIDVYALNTGLSAGGIDLGSRNMSTLEKPSVAILGGGGVSSYEVGEIWHLMDQRYEIPLTLLEKDGVGRTDLNRYNVIILTNGNYGDISEQAASELKRWVRSGGTLIAQRSAINWARSEGLIDVKDKERPEDDEEEERKAIPYVDLSATRGAQGIGGSIFSAVLDLTHPLAYGYHDENIHVFRNSTRFMELSDNPSATPLQLTENPLASGYISDENLEIIGNTASIIVSGSGRGRVISFVDNPSFRAFWFGTNKLLANAIFFGDTISSASTD